MYRRQTQRSLLGLAMLLLAASCVPPKLAGPVAPGAGPVAGLRVAMLPPLAPMKPVSWAEFKSLADPLPAAPSPATDAALAASAAPPFAGFAQNGEDARRSLECLTAAVYYEARSEPLDGQRAVAQVVLNRVRNPAYPSSVCGVVYQGSERHTGCQFTFTCDGSMAYRREPAAWETAQAIAQSALAGYVYAPVGSATNYHAQSILPWWASSLTKVAAVGSQIFYKVSGAIGNALAFHQNYSGVEPGPAGSGSAIAANATPATGNPAVVRYALSGGASVSVYRGAPTVAPDAMVTSPVAGVRVHFGAPTTTPDDAAAQPPEASAATVTVHRGTGATAVASATAPAALTPAATTGDTTAAANPAG